jgi:hypothetical protein
MTLLGPDVLLVAMGGTRPNNAVLVLELGDGLDGARLERALDRLQPLAPFMTGRLERPFPWGRLRWRADDGTRAPVRRRRLAAGEAFEDAIDAVLNTAVDPRQAPPLCWHVLDRHDGASSWLALAWVHPLMDPRGAELLVAMLDAVDRGGDGAAWAAARPVVPPEDPRPLRERGALARTALGTLQALGRERVVSLAQHGAVAGRVRHRRRLVRSRPRQLPQTLAAVGRAIAAAAAARGLPTGAPFVVPISVDRRRKGEPGPVFGNFLSFHFARLRPEQLDDPAATVAALRRDMAEAVRTNFVEGLWAGMNIIRYYPPRHLLRPLGGREIASFHCADTGDVRPPLATLLGVPVRSAYHAPCVHPHPGLGLFFTRVGELESIVAVWVDGVLGADEIECLLDGVATSVDAAPAA